MVSALLFGDGFVAGSMLVEDLHIEKGCVEVVSLETIYLHIEASVMFSDGSSVWHFFTSEGRGTLQL